MGPSSPSDPARPGRRGWWALALLAPLALLGLAGGLALNRYAIPEVRPPYPTAQLMSEQTAWDVRGFHTLRVYRAPASAMRDVLEWYFGEDIIGRYGPHAQEPAEFKYLFSTPTPAQPLMKVLLARYSQVTFTAQKGYIEVVTDTHFYWHHLN